MQEKEVSEKETRSGQRRRKKTEAIDVTETKEGQCQNRRLSNIKYCRGQKYVHWI